MEPPESSRGREDKKMATEALRDRNLEKQIGCMTGFFQIFYRHQLLSGKRIYSAKHLSRTHSPKVDSVSEPEVRVSEKELLSSSAKWKATEKKLEVPDVVEAPVKPPLPLPLPLQVFQMKQGTRTTLKFKEIPRLSLDSRATVDATGGLYPKPIRCAKEGNLLSGDESDRQRSSTSVVARLMGLEPLSDSLASPGSSSNAQLRRSASESRVSRDLFQFRFSVDGNSISGANAMTGDANVGVDDRARDLLKFSPKTSRSESPSNRGYTSSSRIRRKSCYDSTDFFPVPKQAISVYGEIARRLKMDGIDECSQDLETLKHIFEALQLKGLLRSPRKPNGRINRNMVYDRPQFQSPIVVMKPSRSPTPANDSPPSRLRSRANPGSPGATTPTHSPRQSPQEIRRNNAPSTTNQPRFRNSVSPTRRDSISKTDTCRRKPLRVETQRKVNDVNRASSPTQSPKLKGSPRIRKQTSDNTIPKEDECSSVSAESSFSTPSQTDTERSKGLSEYRTGTTTITTNILDKCDKLLHSIAEMTSTELQPSPVSVLDTSSFYKAESSPSPVMKRRSIGFGDPVPVSEDEIYSPEELSEIYDEKTGNAEFDYISEILRTWKSVPEGSDIHHLLEKRRHPKGRDKDTSKESRIHRKLIFDAVVEILEFNRRIPPWKSATDPEAEQISDNIQKMGDVETPSSEIDVSDAIGRILRKDLAVSTMTEWGEWPIEASEIVLYIEQQVFRDLISDTIQSLAFSAGNFRETNHVQYRRKIIF